MIPPFAIPVSAIKASQEFLDRIEENPRYYATPESRLILQLPRELSPLPPRGMAFLTMGGRVFVLDERTDEEKAADAAATFIFPMEERWPRIVANEDAV